MLILDLWGISFHAVVVFGLGKNLLFKSIPGRCEVRQVGASAGKHGKITNTVIIQSCKMQMFPN